MKMTACKYEASLLTSFFIEITMERYNFEGRKIYFSGPTPFDRSYHWTHQIYDLKIAQLLCTIMNASMEVISNPRVTDLSVYERNPNAWVVEQLVRGVADMSSSTLVLTPDSEQFVAYTMAIGTFRPQLYYKAQSIRMAENIYYIPFAEETWLLLLCLLLIITVVLTFILARETRLPHSTPYDIIARIADQKHEQGIDWNKIKVQLTSEEAQQREHWELSEILLVSIGAICQQGSERDPNTAAARTLLLVLFLFAVLIYTAYSASVISLISLLPNTDTEFHMGWIAARNNQVFLHDTNFFRYNFEVSGRHVEYVKLEDGLNASLFGKGVFVADRDVALTTLHKLSHGPDVRCSLARAFPGLEYQRVFALRRKSPYIASVNYNILRLRQYGLLSREKRKVFNLRTPCSLKDRTALSGFVSIDLTDTLPAIKLMTMGMLCAILVFVAEYFIFYSSLELKKAFGNSWKKFEEVAGSILNRWLRLQIQNEYKKNKKIIVNNEKLNKSTETYKPFLH